MLSQKMMHSVTFPTNKGKQRKEYCVLSPNHNLKLKSNNETYINIFVKNFLCLSSFFIFIVIPHSYFTGMNTSNFGQNNNIQRCNQENDLLFKARTRSWS